MWVEDDQMYMGYSGGGRVVDVSGELRGMYMTAKVDAVIISTKANLALVGEPGHSKGFERY